MSYHIWPYSAFALDESRVKETVPTEYAALEALLAQHNGTMKNLAYCVESEDWEDLDPNGAMEPEAFDKYTTELDRLYAEVYKAFRLATGLRIYLISVRGNDIDPATADVNEGDWFWAINVINYLHANAPVCDGALSLYRWTEGG